MIYIFLSHVFKLINLSSLSGNQLYLFFVWILIGTSTLSLLAIGEGDDENELWNHTGNYFYDWTLGRIDININTTMKVSNENKIILV